MSGGADRRARSRRAAANARRIKIRPGSALEKLLTEKIAIEKRSPEQVSGWLRLGDKEPVCARTVYDRIYSERKDLLAHLHCRKGKYRRSRANGLRKAARAGKRPRRGTSEQPPGKPWTDLSGKPSSLFPAGAPSDARPT